MTPTQRILVVDDDRTVRELMLAALLDAGYQVDAAADGCEALERVQRAAYDVIVIDWQMPNMDGCTFFDLYATLPNQHASVVLCSAIPTASVKLANREPVGFLEKPFGLDDLYRCVSECVR